MDGWMGMQAYTASRIDSVVEENWQDPVFQAQKANTVRKNVLFAPFIYKNDLFTKTGSGQTSEKYKASTFFSGDAEHDEGRVHGRDGVRLQHDLYGRIHLALLRHHRPHLDLLHRQGAAAGRGHDGEGRQHRSHHGEPNVHR
jgi:hypothetical protein